MGLVLLASSPDFTSEELLLVVQAVSLNGGQLVLVLLDYLLQRAVQVLLLLLEKLLFLDAEQQRRSLSKAVAPTSCQRTGPLR